MDMVQNATFFGSVYWWFAALMMDVKKLPAGVCYGPEQRPILGLRSRVPRCVSPSGPKLAKRAKQGPSIASQKVPFVRPIHNKGG